MPVRHESAVRNGLFDKPGDCIHVSKHTKSRNKVTGGHTSDFPFKSFTCNDIQSKNGSRHSLSCLFIALTYGFVVHTIDPPAASLPSAPFSQHKGATIEFYQNVAYRPTFSEGNFWGVTNSFVTHYHQRLG